MGCRVSFELKWCVKIDKIVFGDAKSYFFFINLDVSFDTIAKFYLIS